MAEAPRLASLDYIRGLAILGILAVNAAAFAVPMPATGNPALWPFPLSMVDLWLWWAIHTFLEAKLYTLFSMLFGISLYLVGQKADPHTPFVRHPLTRRLGWLVLFGLIHGALIWWGDILLLYALTGFVFWRWRSLSGPKLLVWGVIFWLIGSALMSLALFSLQPFYAAHPDYIPQTLTQVQTDSTLMRSGFLSSLTLNYRQWSGSLIFTLLLYMPKIMGLMMIGLGLFKSGFFTGRFPTAPFLIAGAAALSLIGWQNFLDMRAGFPPGAHEAVYGLANEWLSPVVSLGYAALLMRLSGTALTRLLAPVGRMAFTNYLTQSLIMTAIFYGGRGFGLFGTMGYGPLLAIVATIWIAQIIWSHQWLKTCRYGPFEWLWRSLSQGRRVSLK